MLAPCPLNLLNRPPPAAVKDLPDPTAPATASWSQRYGQRHRLVHVTDFPSGVAPPKKVRLYHRLDHYVLQWWDPAARRNLSDRVDGDIVSAIARARQIEERLAHFRSAGQGKRRLTHDDVTTRFLADLQRRADAGAVDSGAVRRYTSALTHYRVFCTRPEIRKAFPSPQASTVISAWPSPPSSPDAPFPRTAAPPPRPGR